MSRSRAIPLVFCLLLARVTTAQVSLPVSHHEVSAAAQGGGGVVEVEGTLLLPPTVKPVQAIITILHWGVGTWVYDDPVWRSLANDLGAGLLRLAVRNHGGPEDPLALRAAQQAVRNASLGGAEAVLNLLEQLARQAGRPELREAKLLFWGHSAAGSFGTSFAALHPSRTIAFVRYHSHSRNMPVDVPMLAKIPGLIFAGEKDTTAGVEDSEVLWRSGRRLNAPWTFALEPGATHGSREALIAANQLALPWVRTVFERRMSDRATDLRPVGDRIGWLAAMTGNETSVARSFRGPKADAAWLPDEASVIGWRRVTGTRKP